MAPVSIKPFAVGSPGHTLRGAFYQSGDSTRRRPVLVMLHGFTGNRMDSDDMFPTLARSVAARGIHALTFDFRGSGESDGTFEQMLPSHELADTLAVLQWVQGRPQVDRTRIGLLGFSLGGLLACCASARFPSLRALVLTAPTTVKNLHRFAKPADGSGPIVVGSRTLHPRFFDDLETLDPLADAVKNPRPTLLVHGTADRSVAPSLGKQYVEALRRASIEIEESWVEGANHVFAGPQQRAALNAAVSDFCSRTL